IPRAPPFDPSVTVSREPNFTRRRRRRKAARAEQFWCVAMEARGASERALLLLVRARVVLGARALETLVDVAADAALRIVAGNAVLIDVPTARGDFFDLLLGIFPVDAHHGSVGVEPNGLARVVVTRRADRRVAIALDARDGDREEHREDRETHAPSAPIIGRTEGGSSWTGEGRSCPETGRARRSTSPYGHAASTCREVRPVPN